MDESFAESRPDHFCWVKLFLEVGEFLRSYFPTALFVTQSHKGSFDSADVEKYDSSRMSSYISSGIGLEYFG